MTDSFVGKLNGLSESELRRNLDATSEDPTTEKLLQFVQEVLANKGHVSDQLVQKLRELDFSDEVLIETVANVALNVFTNFFNHVARTEVDFPKVSAR